MEENKGNNFIRKRILSMIPKGALTEEEEKELNSPDPASKNRGITEKGRAYLAKLKEPKPKPKDWRITSKEIARAVPKKFKKMYGFDWVSNNHTRVQLWTVAMYFAREERFFRSPILRKDLSKPSFDKGLLVIGGYGCGKTTLFQVLFELFRGTPLVYGMYHARQMVMDYENSRVDHRITPWLNARLKYEELYDDVKSEPLALAYGRREMMSEVLEQRSFQKKRTHLLCNYAPNRVGDVEAALHEFGTMYGERVYDRLFEMFNILEFKGESLRI